MAKLSTTELLDAFKELTLIELSEFVKEFETTFGVTAAAPVAVAAAAAPAAAAATAQPQRKKRATRSTSSSRPRATRSQVIKEVRSLTSLGLKEAKDLVGGSEGCPGKRSTRKPPARPRRPSGCWRVGLGQVS